MNLADAITGGLSTGLLKGVNKVISAVKTLISHIPQAIKDILGIHSPSKVVADLMEFVGDGGVVGLDNQTDKITKSASGLGDAAVNGLKNSLAGISSALNDNIDMSPTIRPVIDLSAIKDGAKLIPGMIPSPSLSVNTSTDLATSVSLQEQAKNAQLILQQDNTKQTPTIAYTQNNFSPKALSTVELYRQTNNQLSTLKGALGVVNQDGSS